MGWARLGIEVDEAGMDDIQVGVRQRLREGPVEAAPPQVRPPPQVPLQLREHAARRQLRRDAERGQRLWRRGLRSFNRTSMVFTQLLEDHQQWPLLRDSWKDMRTVCNGSGQYLPHCQLQRTMCRHEASCGRVTHCRQPVRRRVCEKGGGGGSRMPTRRRRVLSPLASSVHRSA